MGPSGDLIWNDPKVSRGNVGNFASSNHVHPLLYPTVPKFPLQACDLHCHFKGYAMSNH